MRTITLELLRHGTAHNQLLSPLTPYLALCENHAAVTLHVPFEHNQFLHQLSALDYKTMDDSRTFQLRETARVLGKLLSEIPGLTAESNKANNEEPLTHLRLIISASELALLPFELCLSPDGLPGAGQHLLLQPQMPICMTREVRRVPEVTINWKRKPKILFIAAAPPEVGPIPLESHLLVLRRLISPWIKYYGDDNERRRRRVAEHLHIIPNATIKTIEDACASGEYTHIHILAHGVEKRENYDTRFALALHHRSDPNKMERIDGTQLATALRASKRPDNEFLSTPLVVTLASCNSGGVGTVAGAGSSIAHALHESGVPMVVAGQFPLSFEGSIQILECLYDGLLWGREPRALLYDLRRRLYSQFQDNHDWASLVSYFSLPSDFEPQLEQFKIDQAMNSINAAFDYADEVTRHLFTKMKKSRTAPEELPASEEKKSELVEIAKRKIEQAMEKLTKLADLIPSKKLTVIQLLASTEKRQAEVLFAATNKSDQLDSKTCKRYKKDCFELLKRAREHYWNSFLLDRSKAGPLVQYLSLTLVLQRRFSEFPNGSISETSQVQSFNVSDENLVSLWSLAHLLSLQDLNVIDKELKTRNWANYNLIELYLLLLIMPQTVLPLVQALPPPPEPLSNFVQDRAFKYTTDLVEGAGVKSIQVRSIRRQVERYIEWFDAISMISPLPAIAEGIYNRIPYDDGENWEYE